MNDSQATQETLDGTAPSLGGTFDSTPPTRPEVELETGAMIGRYVVLGRVGAGAMGVVYAAYDPELERKIALKLLRRQPSAGSSGHGQLLREAQAMAKLSHPNVVAVHDVGVHQGRVFVAMEFVDGQTLREWLADGSRHWADILDVFVRAGHGLLAAHAQGLVHRDFKPDNVMISEDQRVRVMDFGLARVESSSPPSGVDHTLAWAGVVGTPAYMPPEQFASAQPGPAGDQFSFCVSVWEALHRQRPFAGTTLVELATHVMAGEVRRPSTRSRVPGWLRRTVERGLQVDPQRRWPSMTELLDALERGRTRARWRVAIGIAVAFAIAGLASAGWQRHTTHQATIACEAAGAEIDQVWNDSARAHLRNALAGSGSNHAAETADKVLPWLDDHAHAWRVARTGACMDATVDEREPWDAALLDRSTWCLDERRMELEALVAELSSGESRAIANAVQAVAGLGRVDACRDADLLARLPTPPSEDREQVRPIWAELARASALRATGDYAEGLPVARASLDRAIALGWLPLIASAQLRVGMLLESTGAYEDAATIEQDAFFAAAAAGADDIAADAATRLILTVGERLARHDEGLTWSRHVELILGKLPDPGRLREAGHLNNLAIVHYAKGSYGEAEQLHAQALAIHEMLGPDHPDVANSLNNLAAVHQMTGAYAEAKPLHERALAIRTRALGAEHPEVANSLANLASVHYALDELDEAKRLHLQALAIREATLGPDHPHVANSLNSLANLHWSAREFADARARYERALSIFETALGLEHPTVAIALSNLAGVYFELHDYAQAQPLYERALLVFERALGPDHPEVALALTNLANVHIETGAFARAKPLHQRALACYEKSMGPSDSSLVDPLVGLARIATAEHDKAHAIDLATRAVELAESGSLPADEVDRARAVLLAASPVDRE